MKRALTMVVMAATATVLSGWVGASASSSGAHRHEIGVRIAVTSAFFVDNDPSGASGGDLFGSTGDMRRHGRKIGTYSSACTAVSASAGQCQATLAWKRGGRLQLSGHFELGKHRNRLAIVGGTGRFRGAGGDAVIQDVNQQGNVQHVGLTLLR